MKTSILPVDTGRIGRVQAKERPHDLLDDFDFTPDPDSLDGRYLLAAAEQIRTSDVPVAFPTETVYGLGADATRSQAVKGIYKAKQRPSDNPLIVHFASLQQIRALLNPSDAGTSAQAQFNGSRSDPIPAIYRPLIKKFWPGPLTILLPNPPGSKLAPEVTAGLTTFGARMPRHLIALALIQLSGVPVAAPSANASTKPSPTAAEHVAFDLDGRIETIIDGGPCDVGVESTVVDGLSDPPLILRPGGISVEQMRACPGWENVAIGYEDLSDKDSKPKAPGMKYRHYSPKATVILFESGRNVPKWEEILHCLAASRRIGVVRTCCWSLKPDRAPNVIQQTTTTRVQQNGSNEHEDVSRAVGVAGMLQHLRSQHSKRSIQEHSVSHDGVTFSILDVELGADPSDVARGIFGALRDLDRENVDAILVEGIDEMQGDLAAAVMNRLRKAAELQVAGA